MWLATLRSSTNASPNVAMATRPDWNTLWVKSLPTRTMLCMVRVVRLSAATTTPSWHTTATAKVTGRS
jgi:hypothetical protein